MGFSQTIIGLIILIAGLLGVGDILPEEEVASVVNGIIETVGVIWTWYGRFRQGDINAVGFKK